MDKIWQTLSVLSLRRTSQQDPSSAALSPISLASEIWDYIIDYLHDDKLTLSVCTLVYRTWTQSARHHLFRRITLYLDVNAGKVLDKFSSLPISGAIVPHIRELRVIAEENAHRNFLSTAQWSSTDLLPHFPFVRRMSLAYACTGENMSPKTLHWIKRQMQQLDTLALQSHVKNIDQTLALIASSPSLEHLSINDIQQLENLFPFEITETFRNHIPAPINRITLSFSTTHYDLQLQLIHWIEFHHRNQAIRAFRASGLTKASLPAFKTCMDASGKWIEHLALRVQSTDIGSLTPNIDLSGTIALRSISIRIKAFNFLDRVCDMLSQIPSQVLQEVIFELHFTAGEHIGLRSIMFPAQSIETFCAMDEYFADENPKYPAQSALVRFVLCYMGYHRPEPDGELIEPFFPRTHELGRLQVEIVGESDVGWF